MDKPIRPESCWTRPRQTGGHRHCVKNQHLRAEAYEMKENVKYLVKSNHHLDETGVSLSRCNVDRQRPVLTLLVQVSSVPQQQAAEFGVTKDGRNVKRRVAGDVCTAGLSATRQQKLRHPVVGSADCVVQRSSTFVVLEVDVGVQLKQRVDGHVQTSTYGNQQSRLATSLTLSSATPHLLITRSSAVAERPCGALCY